MLSGSRRRFSRTFCDRADAGSKITTVPQGIDFDAEYRADREALRGDTLLRNSSGTCHLNAPVHVFSITALCQLAVWPDEIEMEFRMVRLRDELMGYSC